MAISSAIYGRIGGFLGNDLESYSVRRINSPRYGSYRHLQPIPGTANTTHLTTTATPSTSPLEVHPGRIQPIQTPAHTSFSDLGR